MNRFLTILLVIYLSTQVNCLYLHNICSNSTFEYKGIEVNSFLQKTFNVTLGEVGNYAIDEENLQIDNLFAAKEDTESFQKEIDNYHSYLKELYSEEFLNADDKIKNIHLEKEKITALKKKLDNITLKAYSNKQNQIYYATEAVNRLTGLIDHISVAAKSRLSGYIMSFNGFTYFIDNLEINPKTETFAFQNEFLIKIYKKEMVQFEKYIFVRGSRKYYDMKNSYGILQISLSLPFNTKEFREQPSCFELNKLPPFFANKGKE